MQPLRSIARLPMPASEPERQVSHSDTRRVWWVNVYEGHAVGSFRHSLEESCATARRERVLKNFRTLYRLKITEKEPRG